MSSHHEGEQDDLHATNYGAPPSRPDDPTATRYSDEPPHNGSTDTYTPAPDMAEKRLPRRFGDYELLEELGHGSMGVVYKARQFTPERLVALKVIRAGELATEEDVRRFRQEADEAARLDHPHITPVYEVGEQDGMQYFTMKLMEGGSLSQHLKRYLIHPKAAAQLAATAARAVHYAHQRQLLHRDLKPGNILLDAAGQPHVADFGLAKRMGGAGEASQSHGAGTPEYMAPEQARGDARLTTAADVYGLGGVLYSLLTGRPPFRGVSTWTTLEKVLTEEPTLPSKIRPAVPHDLEIICLKCLQKEPARRYGSAEAMAEDLERWLRGEPVRARPVGPVERMVKWARRRPALAAMYGFLLLALVLGTIGIGATLLWRDAEVARARAITIGDDLRQVRDDLAKALRKEQAAKSGEQEARRELMRLAYIDRINLAQREWDSGAVKHARELLGEAGRLLEELTPGVRPEKRPWEWGYLNRLYHPELIVLEGHTSGVSSVAFSPDGARLATASWDNTVRLWDAATGKQLMLLEGDTSVISVVAFSPDGARLASAGDDKTVRLWDAATGKQLALLEGHTEGVLSVEFSPDGARLASASDDKTVRLWDAATGKQLALLKGHTKVVNWMAFSPDGARLASASDDKTVRLWDAATGMQLALLKGHTDYVYSVAFSPDGARLASASYDKTVRLWDATTGKQLALLEGHTGPVYSVAFSPDGARLASASLDRTVRLWDAATGEQLALLEGHTGSVISVAFSPDGARLASAGLDKTVRLWDVATGERFALLEGQLDSVNWVAFSPDGARLASASKAQTVRLWDVATGERLTLLEGQTDSVNWVAFSPDGARLASVGEDNTVRLWDAATGKQLVLLEGHTEGVLSVAFSPNGARLASASNDGTVRLWDAATGEQLALLEGHRGRVFSVEFSPDGARLASASDDKTVRLWDAATGKQLALLEGHTKVVSWMAFSPDGAQLAFAGEDNTVRLWDAATGKQLALLEGHTDKIFSVAFSPDGARLASAGKDNTVRLWDAATGKQLVLLEGDTSGISVVAFSPDGARLASAGLDNTVRRWIARESPKDHDKRRHFWREQQAADAEKDGQWFAAAFHLSRLIDANPADATLYARRCGAEFRLGRWQPTAVDFLQALTRWPADNKR